MSTLGNNLAGNQGAIQAPQPSAPWNQAPGSPGFTAPQPGQPGYGQPYPSQPQPTTTGTATTTNPLQPTYLGAPPVAGTTLSGANVSPDKSLAYLNKADQQNNAQAYSNLQNQLAASGIVGGGATAAIGSLGQQLSAADASANAGAVQNAQGMTLEQALANAQASNNMSQFNVGNTIGTNQFNAGAANQSGTTLAEMLQGNYANQFNAFSGLNEQQLAEYAALQGQGLGAAGNLGESEANNFPVQQGNTYSDLGSALGGAFNPGGGGSTGVPPGITAPGGYPGG